MPKQTAFRYAWLAGLCLLLVLSACGCATASPMVSVTATPTEGTATPRATPSLPVVVTHDTPTAMSPTILPTPTAKPPFPALLRRLNLGIPAGNSYYPGPMAVHPGLQRLYVITLDKGGYGQQRGQVTVLDLRSGEVLFVAETGASDLSDRALTVDTLRDRVYARNSVDNTCTILDALSLEALAILEDVRGVALDQPGGRLFVARQAGLRVLDVANYRVLREGAMPFEGAVEAMAVDSANGRVYVAQMEGGQFVLAQYDVDTLERLATTPLPGGCRDLVPDPARDRVYVAVGTATDSLWTVGKNG
jgi:hypothetical protein